MATYLTSHPVRRAANRLFALRNHYNSLSESVLTGLGMFGLATNGMCLAALALSLSEVLRSGPRGREATYIDDPTRTMC
jgi:hypothetical protein